MKSIFETLAALSAGAVLLSGCGASPAPVNATEVPAASDAKPSTPAAPAEMAAKQVAPAAVSAAPAAAPMASSTAKPAASAAPSAAPSATPHAKPKKAAGAKKTNDTGSCGAGTCG